MSAPKNYGLITSQAELDMFLDVIAAADQPWGLDIETGYSGQEMKGASLHPDYPDSFIVGISFSGDPSWARYVPLAHDYCPQNMTNAVEVARSFWRILRRGKVVIHNAAFELRFMRLWFLQHLSDDPEFGEEVCASNGYFQFFADSMIDSYLAAELESHGLKYITKTAFGHDQVDIHSLFQAANPSGKPRTAAQKKALRFNELELTPEVISYCCEDAAWCLSVHWRYYPMVKDMTLYRVERAIVPILCEMEDYGVRYDWPAMKAKAAEGWSFLEKLNAEIQRDLTAATGRPQNVNIGSPQQLVKVLYEEMGLKTRRKTETGNLSTDKQALTGLAQRYKVVAKILAWKQLKKLLGTYLEKYEREYDYAEDGRTHPSHMQVTVSSGRFAVADPPYQQSPKKYHLELEDGTLFECDFRKFIIAPPDHYILGFDFSQVELRMLAGDSKEPALIHAFDNDIDVHTATAALMFNKPIDQVTKEDRDKGKAQPLDAKILTPTGWRLMGELQVGDFVIGGDGEATKITGVFPQGTEQVYRVTTSDGASTECSAGHLWTTLNKNWLRGGWQTRSLQELLDSGLREKNGTQQPRYSLPARPVVQYEPGPDLPIDPYVLGLLLGDGTFRHDWGPSFGSADPELLDAFESEIRRMGALPTERKLQGTGTPFWTMFATCAVKNQRGGNPMTEALRALGLWGKLGYEKCVPELYLRATPADRLALLQGLLDTDGSVQHSGANFRVTSLALAEAVQELARSLGGAATLSVGHLSSSNVLPQWRVQLTLPSGMAPFRLARKEAKRKSVRVVQSSERIISAELVGEKETQCISVAANNGHYLTDSYITTHNTLNFALLYGMGLDSLAERLGVMLEEAERLYAQYFSAYSNIDKWVEYTQNFGRNTGYVTTRFGRKVVIWEFTKAEKWIQAKGERLCLNAPIQGAAADYMKVAMVRAQAALRAAGLLDRVHLVMNIHDALEYYVHESVDPKTVVDILAPAVSFPVDGLPKIVAEWHKGLSWGTVTEIKVVDGVMVETGQAPEREEYAPDNEEAMLTHSSAGSDMGNGTAVPFTGMMTGDTKWEPEQALRPRTPSELQIESVVEVQQSEVNVSFPVEPLIASPTIQVNECRRIKIRLPDTPDTAQFAQFQELLQSMPGNNTPVLVLPDGEVSLGGAYRSSLTPQDQARVSLVFPGATVVWDAASIDADELVAGLKL